MWPNWCFISFPLSGFLWVNKTSAKIFMTHSWYLIRVISHGTFIFFCPTGPVTNAAIIPAPARIFLTDSRPSIPLPRFSRHLNPSEQGDGTGAGGVCVRPGANTQVHMGFTTVCVYTKNTFYSGWILYAVCLCSNFCSFIDTYMVKISIFIFYALT